MKNTIQKYFNSIAFVGSSRTEMFALVSVAALRCSEPTTITKKYQKCLRYDAT
jgi:hypothetical protein